MDEFKFAIYKLIEEKESISSTLVRGNVADIAEYKRLCGKYEGLDIAIRVVNDIKDSYDIDEDD
jgi:hypothetical protein